MIPLPEALRFGSDGLVPAIVQDVTDGTVLMLAYMNEEALDMTRRTGYTHFWSRSRQALWKKGETSGNVQRVVSMSYDCDGDALLVAGPGDGRLGEPAVLLQIAEGTHGGGAQLVQLRRPPLEPGLQPHDMTVGLVLREREVQEVVRFLSLV